MDDGDEKIIQASREASDAHQVSEGAFLRASSAAKEVIARLARKAMHGHGKMIKRITFMDGERVAVTECWGNREYTLNTDPEDSGISIRPSSAGFFEVESVPFVLTRKPTLRIIGKQADRAGLLDNSSVVAIEIHEDPSESESESGSEKEEQPVFEVTMNDETVAKKTKMGE